jgi:hypothetical protein
MPDKNKKTKKDIKVRDLKPRKDAKGGFSRQTTSRTQTSSHQVAGATYNK